MRLESFRARGFGPFRNEFAVDLRELGQARLVALVGRNGAGKSTLLELWGPGALYRSTPTRGSLRDLATERNAFIEARVVNGSTWTIRHTVDAISGKGESVVLDEAGSAVLTSAKLREFDEWSSKHLPSPEVFFSTVFAAQGAGGFLGMKPAERKGVLLRVLGVERLEAMAERAREHSRQVRAVLATLEARIADERARTGDVAQLEQALHAARAHAAEVDGAGAESRRLLTEAQQQAERARAERERVEAVAEQRRALGAQIEQARSKVCDLQTRIANNRAMLAEAEKIRTAVEQLDQLKAELGKAERDELELRSVLRRLEDAAAAHDRTARDAHVAWQAAEDRALRARKRLDKRDAIESAKAQLAALREAADAAVAETQAAEKALEGLQAKRVAGAEERIEGLRGGLDSIARGHPLPEGHARETLHWDDHITKQAAELPSKIAEAETAWRAARDRASVARRRATDAEALAARATDLEAAEAEAQAAEAEALEHASRRDQARMDARQADESRTEQSADLARTSHRVNELRAELAKLEPIARKAEPLAKAEARLAELKPQLEAAQSELDAAAQQLTATPEPAAPPPASDVAAFEVGVSQAEEASRRAHAAIAVAEQRLSDARAGDERLEQLEGERRTLEAELADWNRLADDFGRDGLQALEIDAAGPELSALVNDLLHTAFGPRWTVTIETQRLSADGKRQLEGCEVRVLDTENGRDAEASTFSGGERVILGEAVSLALSMLACRRSGIEGPTLVRDESGAALDANNARAYIAMLRRAADIVGARNVLFVSHSPEVQELADARIEVGRG